MLCMLEKQTLHSFCLIIKLGFISADVYILKVTRTDRSVENLRLICKVPLHDVMVGMWCAVNAIRITGPIFSDTINLY